jgi:hypothetical protein
MSDIAQPTRLQWFANNYGRVAAASFAVAAVGALVGILAGQGYQMEALPLGTSFAVLRWGAYISVAGGLLCLLSIILAVALYKGEFLGKSAIAVAGLVIGLFAFYVPYSMQRTAQSVPPIHDITTDVENPPEFIAVVPLREKARNPPEYMRENKLGQRVLNVPEEQLKAYPDIKTIELSGVPPADAFNRALEAVKQHKWTIVAASPEEGRIEAWDKTPWFGFIDDVVIRVTSGDGGSRVDIRSLSRVGGSDVGKNAQRIRAYMKTFASIKG